MRTRHSTKELAKRYADREYLTRFDNIAGKAASRGMTHRQLSELLCVPYPTFEAWIDKHKSLCKAIRKGRDKYNTTQVEHTLLDRAMGRCKVRKVTTTNVVLHRGKGDDAIALPAEKVTETIEELPPEPGLLRFFLTVRDRKRWQQKQQIEVQGKIDHIAKLGELGIDKLQTIADTIDIDHEDLQ